jgi:hypothetical protein
VGLEPVNCPQCGAASGFEKIEPGLYRCSYHNGLLRITGPNSAAVLMCCEIDNCGVVAEGRCVYCRRTFCRSHRSIPIRRTRRSSQIHGQDMYSPWPYEPTVDGCGACQRQAVDTDQAQRAQELAAARAAREDALRVRIEEERKWDRSIRISPAILLLTTVILNIGIFYLKWAPWPSLFLLIPVSLIALIALAVPSIPVGKTSQAGTATAAFHLSSVGSVLATAHFLPLPARIFIAVATIIGAWFGLVTTTSGLIVDVVRELFGVKPKEDAQR